MMNVIAGMPRAGSTLLCNLLNQNPSFQATSTSILPGMIMLMSQYWSNSLEIRGALINDRLATEVRMRDTMLAIARAWYPTDKTVFDKGRQWTGNLPLFFKVFPTGKVIICLRDLREIVASIEKQHLKNPILNVAPGMNVRQRVSKMLAPKGMLRICLNGLRDILERKLDVYFLRAEELTRFPQQVMERLYAFLEEPTFEHTLEGVLNTAEDVDALYLHKYPHEGSGDIYPLEPSWQKYLSDGLASEITSAFPWYNEAFGYGGRKLRAIRHVPAA